MSGETNGNGRIKVSFNVVATIVVWLVTVMLAYGAIDARLKIIEDRYERLFQDVRDIKSDVKTLLERAR